MDNRVNKVRREITVLRAAMLKIEELIRDQISLDLDCSESALRLMAMRAELAALVGQWKAAGGRRPATHRRGAPEAKLSPGREAQGGTPRHRRSSLMGSAGSDRWTGTWCC
jgi:hypothetical protein